MVNPELENGFNFLKDKGLFNFMINITTDELIKAGAHFGHPTSRWHPGFRNYISMKKNGVHIIDLDQTSQCMYKAAQEIIKI